MSDPKPCREDFDLALEYWKLREGDVMKAYDFYQAHREAIDRAMRWIVDRWRESNPRKERP